MSADPDSSRRFCAAFRLAALGRRACSRHVCLLAVWAVVWPAGQARADGQETIAVRTGWAYGVGLELEIRPGSWGVGASGGYVPGLGAGGYLGVQWGLRPLRLSGWVAEAGLFRGVHNPLRVAKTGLGLYALAGYALGHAGGLSVRMVAGGGVPLGDPAYPISFEILAKLTAGVVF